MKIFILILALIGLLNGEEGVKKVVYDLTTGDVKTFEKKILSAIAFEKAHYESKFEELEVAVIIHGDAYKFFIDDLALSPFKDDKKLVDAKPDLSKRISSMFETYNVEFLMCGVGMKKFKIEKSTLYKFVKVVPNSTIGLIDKQNEGFAYIPVSN